MIQKMKWSNILCVGDSSQLKTSQLKTKKLSQGV